MLQYTLREGDNHSLLLTAKIFPEQKKAIYLVSSQNKIGIYKYIYRDRHYIKLQLQYTWDYTSKQQQHRKQKCGRRFMVSLCWKIYTQTNKIYVYHAAYIYQPLIVVYALKSQQRAAELLAVQFKCNSFVCCDQRFPYCWTFKYYFI